MTTTSQTALSVIFKERIRDMPNNLNDKEILAYAKIIKNIIELENELKNIGKEETKMQTAFSCVFKERIQNMPDNIDDKEILVYSKNIVKLVKDINKIGKGKKNPKNKE
jgi:flagellar biosynthesis regulator FlbT